MSGHPTRHTDSLLRKAVEHQKAGQTERAARFYREILRIDPDHGDAAHRLGRIAHQAGRPQAAAALFTAAARGNATVAPYHLALGLAQWDSGNPRAAAASARRTLALCPSDPAALCLLGAVTGWMGDRRTALRSFHAAARLDPTLPEARVGLGRVWERAGNGNVGLRCYQAAARLRGPDADGWLMLAHAFHRFDHPVEAVSAYQEVLKRDVDRAAAWANLGSVWHALGQAGQAQQAYGEAVRRAPDHADALNNLGLLHLGMGGVANARPPLNVALAVAPQLGTALVNLGVAEAAVGRFEAAAVWQGRALALNPQQPEGWNNLGVARKGLGQAATACWKRALALNPAFADALGNLGADAIDRAEPDAAARLLGRAVRLMPDHAPLCAAHGRALRDAGRLLEAARQCRRSLAVAPSLTDPRRVLATIEARLGMNGSDRGPMGADRAPPHRFSRGLLALDRAVMEPNWSDCVHRPDPGHTAPALPTDGWERAAIPEWQGEALADQRLLITVPAEPWDAFSAAACWPDAIALAERVEIRCPPTMASLFARAFPRAEVRAAIDAEPTATPPTATPPTADADADRSTPTVRIAADRLPHRLRDRLGRLPARTAWLYADAGRMAEWRERLDRLGGGLRVGLIQPDPAAVATGPVHEPPLDWGPVLRLPGVTVIDFQEPGVLGGLPAGSAAPLADGWRGDLEETAALLSCLDLMIAPPRSLAELAVALGVPVWCYGARGLDGGTGGESSLPGGLTRRVLRPEPGQPMSSLVMRIATDVRRLSRLNRGGDARITADARAVRRLN